MPSDKVLHIYFCCFSVFIWYNFIKFFEKGSENNMLSLEDVKKIVKDLPVDEYDVSDDVSLVVYRVDSFEYNEQKQVNLHIDIELIFGDRYEIHEGENLFDYILSFCKIENVEEDEILYSKYQ